MNIPSLLIPKANVEYLRTKDSIEFALDIFRRNSYSAVPVINSDGIYRGTITEGDFLYYIMDNPDADLKKVKVRNILREDFYEAVKITASIDKLLIKCLDQNFVPVTDDRDVFVGIVTRKASTSLESPSMLCSRSPVVTSSSIAASTTDSSSSFPVSFSYASNVPTSAAVQESGNGPATITLASSTPAVASAFLYMPAVQ